jgi:hypothetical protein
MITAKYLISSFDIHIKGLFAVYNMLPAVVSGNKADIPVFGEVFYEVKSVHVQIFVQLRIKLRGVCLMKFVNLTYINDLVHD